MRGKRTLVMAMLVIIGANSFIACGEKQNVIDGGVSTLSNEEIERLPEDQKETELDKKLAAMRKFRKENIKVENGSMSAISYNDESLSGQTSNRPNFSQDEYKIILNSVYDYLAEKFDIDRADDLALAKLDNAMCIDPRINEIYDKEEKGVAKGYTNENIYVHEYEEKDGVYKYLIMVKDDSSWSVIHDGESYLK